jgi:hypothetical protein
MPIDIKQLMPIFVETIVASRATIQSRIRIHSTDSCYTEFQPSISNQAVQILKLNLY